MTSLRVAPNEKNSSQIEQHSQSFCVKVCRVIFDDSVSGQISVTQLRGFLGNLFVDDPEFHHHSENAYHYPLIQHKKADGLLFILGLQNYALILAKRITSVDTISTPIGRYYLRSKRIKIQNEEIVHRSCYYEFVSPWLALNEVNYSLFKTMDRRQRRKFLERILVANVLSCLKGLGIRINFRVKADICQYKTLRVKAHGNLFIGFFARFRLNVMLPDLIGLGKSVSKGYGAIRRIDV
ncbi:MAG: CRISPR-associated endonuclease Cas6 [Candidatus Bathyarchaeia archaeon]